MQNTEAYYISGDALFLTDGSWNNVLIDSVEFWNGKLPAPANGIGTDVNLGASAIQTKQSLSYNRGTITVQDSEFYGWDADPLNNSALEFIERTTAIVDSNIFYDNELAMRLRGPSGGGTVGDGAQVTAKNNVMYNNHEADIRYEDNINNLHLYNNTFGTEDGDFFDPAGGGAGNDFQVLNNLFFGSGKPTEAAHGSNLAVDATSFVDAVGHNYRLTSLSPAREAGDLIAEVTHDFDDVGRPQPLGGTYDVGAFEYVPEPSAVCLGAWGVILIWGRSWRKRRKSPS